MFAQGNYPAVDFSDATQIFFFFFPPNTFPKQTLRTSWQSTKHQPSSAQSRFSAEEHQAIHILIVKQMAKALPDLALIIWRFVYLLNMQQCSQKAFPE